MESPAVVAVAIIQRGATFLIAKDRFDGLWEFPCWEAEQDEDLQACLGEKIKEELGIDVIVESEFSMIRYSHDAGGVMHLHSFLCQLIAGEPQSLVYADAQWVEIGDFAKYEFDPFDIPIVRQLEFKFGGTVPAFFGGTKDQCLAACRMVIETLRKSFRVRGIPEDKAELSCPRCERRIGVATDDALPEKMMYHELVGCALKHPCN